MKQTHFSCVALAAFVFTLAACNNNRGATDDNTKSGGDTSYTDTRRNSSDTANYITKDSGNKSQETIDMNAPTNSRY